MKKNEERVGIVVGFGSNGEGIIKQDGTVVFVPFTLLGEKVRNVFIKIKKSINSWGDYYEAYF